MCDGKARVFPCRRAVSDPCTSSTWRPEKEKGVPVYDIRVTGDLDPRWSEWFDGLTITNLDGGVAVLCGDIVDQAALHGTLNKIRNLNLSLISVTTLEP